MINTERDVHKHASGRGGGVLSFYALLEMHHISRSSQILQGDKSSVARRIKSCWYGGQI